MNFLFFTLIYAKLTDMINSAGFAMMQSMMRFVSGIALLLVTLWILVLGFRIVTGQMREPLMGVVVNMARIGFIVTVASSMSIFSNDIFTLTTTTLGAEINQLVTGNDDTLNTAIDKNLAYTEVAMSAIDAVQLVPSDNANIDQANHAAFWAGLGTAGPPMTAAVMLLMFTFALALFVGLGPLFILCLIFHATKPLFQRWLLYGIGTLFSMAVLNLVTAMVLKITAAVAVGMWTTTLLAKTFGINMEGISHQAMEQGGLGMIMTLLIVTVPPMAANFFQGTLGSFMHYSAFGASASNQPSARGPAGVPNTQQASSNNQSGGGGSLNPGLALGPSQSSAHQDQIKQPVSSPLNALLGGNAYQTVPSPSTPPAARS